MNTRQKGTPLHYYGDVVRAYMLLAAVCMLVTLPIFNADLPIPFWISLLSIAVVAIVAGILNPALFWTAVLALCITLTGLLATSSFGYYVVLSRGIQSPLFMLNELLALIFLVGVYYSVKTIRGFIVHRDVPLFHIRRSGSPSRDGF